MFIFLKTIGLIFFGISAVTVVQAVEMSTTPTAVMPIHVKDFGAIPNDGQDDTTAIIKAIKHLKQSGAKILQFDAGRYDIDRNGIKLIDIDDLTVQGVTDEHGKPATKLVRNNDFYTNNKGIGTLFSVTNCQRMTVRNLLFDNDPQYATAGEVVALDEQSLTVRIFDDLPRVDGMGAYCMNTWDIKTRRLKQQPSLTFGNDVNKNRKELSWQVVGDDAQRLMRLPSHSIASKVQMGDGLSWHNGFWGYQVLFFNANDLTLSNLWTTNAAGFAMCTQLCHNITADRIVVRSDNNQLATSPRDGWKLYACSGKVVIDDMFIEGVRWDGQNVHGSFLKVIEKQSDIQLLCKKKYSTAWKIPLDTKLTFWDKDQPESRILKSCDIQRGVSDSQFVITLDKPIPSFVTQDTLVTVWGWDIEHYELKNSHFRAIAGSASILRNSHALIQDCTYDNIMYPALMIGAAINEGEGMFPQDVTVSRTTFIDSGWVKRNNALGMLAARTWGSDLPYMGHITVKDCTFKDAALGINFYGTRQVTLKNNHFKNVDTPQQFDKQSVLNVQTIK
ncbi:MAG TPA: hypothetical protein DER01_09560 [Phycisphaerales bacterium]|nr:hypothetical protein [Phycisphaerales bacterium]|tara:strand:+ start:49629 stop:51305 length:1677 start_codon:yes stop_codon:yes gene_type:complete